MCKEIKRSIKYVNQIALTYQWNIKEKRKHYAIINMLILDQNLNSEVC